MDGFGLQLPTIQNWSCHSCSECCTRHVVEITEEERQRLLDQGWSDEDEFTEGTPVVVRDLGPFWNRRWRLGQKPGGACVFLDEQGLCRIHAKYGEPTKPLACRVYPYAFHPQGRQVTVSLRYSCPSVVENKGQRVADQEKVLREMAREVVPGGITRAPSPGLRRTGDLKWLPFRQFVHGLDNLLAESDVPVATKLIAAVRFTDMVSQARVNRLTDDQLVDFVEIIREAARDETQALAESVDNQPQGLSSSGRLLFRMLAAQYARNDSLSNWRTGLMGRVRLLRVGTRFALGRGMVPPLQDIDCPVTFAQLEQPFGGLTPAAEEMFSRYFRVKIQGLQFCGRAFFGFGLIEGFRSLALVFPSMLWLARFMAAADGRDQLETGDVAKAIELADHYHGYTPQFNRFQYRWQIAMMAHRGDICRAIDWYSR
ncbi:MAG: YkgJ family cysteine cluster protein [Planctomycetota bacterium]|nr:YkgJ family cysteine cluster protein [Planctomycetota bacterium]